MSRPSAAATGPVGPRRPTDPGLGRILVRNTLLNFAGRLVSVAGWLFAAPLMLAGLGTERFGAWSLLGALPVLVTTFDLGLGQAISKYVAEHRAVGDAPAQRGVFTLGLGIAGALGALGAVALVLARSILMDFFRIPPALRDEVGRALLAAGALVLSANLLQFCGAVLAGLHRMDRWNLVLIGVTIAQIAGILACLRQGWGLGAIILTTAGVTALGAAGAWILMLREAPDLRIDPRACSRALVQRLGVFSSALQITNLGVLIQFQLPKLLFGRWVSLPAVAHYELGFRVAFAAWAFPALLVPPLLPALSQLDAQGDRERMARLFHRASRYLVVSGLVVSGALFALAPALFAVWLGPGHDGAALAGRALALSLGISVLTTPGSTMVRALGVPWVEARAHLVGIAAHLALGLSLVPRFGVAGGYLALVSAATLTMIVFLWMFHRRFAVPFGAFAREVFVVPLVVLVPAAAGASAIVAAVPSPVGALAIGAVAYGAVALAGLAMFGAVSIAEVREILRALGASPGDGAERLQDPLA